MDLTLSNPAFSNPLFWGSVGVAVVSFSTTFFVTKKIMTLRKKQKQTVDTSKETTDLQSLLKQIDGVLKFEMEADGVHLKCTLTPAVKIESPFDGVLSRDVILQALEQKGYGNYIINDKIIPRICDDFMRASDKKSYTLGECKDCEIKLEISEDQTEALLEIIPARGGKEPTKESLHALLQEHNITFGIQEAVIEQAVQEKKMAPTIVAQGQPAVVGQDTTFEILLDDEIAASSPEVGEDGRVDFREMSNVSTIEPGQVLMRKHPPEKGQAGIDIHGNPLPATDGKVLPFGEVPGAAPSPEDPDILLATRTGCPIIHPNAIEVDPVLVLEEVNMETGNIHFDGSVIVHGGVRSGFKIEATGDVTVHEVVEAAEIEAGGNIELKAGIVGQEKARLQAGQDIIARFVETSTLTAQRNIQIQDILLQSNVAAGDTITMGGEDKSSKGQILGGTIRAFKQIKAKVLGSSASMATMLEVGMNPQVRQEMDQLGETIKTGKKRLQEIEADLKYLESSDKDDREEKTATLIEEKHTLEEEVATASKRESELSKNHEILETAKIIATDKVYGGVKIRIGDGLRLINNDSMGSSFYLLGKDIKVGSP